MSAIMSDVLGGEVNPAVANSAVNAGGKLLKVVDLQHKYGHSASVESNGLILAPSEEEESQADRIRALEAELAQLKKAA